MIAALKWQTSCHFVDMQTFKMSKQEIDSDGFRIVSSKRSAKYKQTKVPYKTSQFIKEENEINVEKSYQ